MRSARRQKGMPFIKPLGNCSSFLGKSDVPFVSDFNIAIFPQFLHGDTNTGFGEFQFIGNINGTNLPLHLFKINMGST